MINLIWIGMVIFGFLYASLTNRLEGINTVILNAPQDAFNIMLAVFVGLVFWNGILEVAKESGVLHFLSKILKKIIKPLFRKIPEDHIALDYISGNIVANMLGLGSAATPLGLHAMQELAKLNDYKQVASKEMITLLVINTSGLTIIPSSILAIRNSYGASITVELIPQIIIASLTTTVIAIFLDFLFRRFSK